MSFDDSTRRLLTIYWLQVVRTSFLMSLLDTPVFSWKFSNLINSPNAGPLLPACICLPSVFDLRRRLPALSSEHSLLDVSPMSNAQVPRSNCQRPKVGLDCSHVYPLSTQYLSLPNPS